MMYSKNLVAMVEQLKGFEQKNPNHCYDLYDHTIKVVEGVANANDEELTIAAMLHDVAKPSCFTEEQGVRKYIGHAKKSAEMAEELLSSEGYPEEQIKNICWLIAEHESDLSSEKSMRKRLSSGGEELVRKVLLLRRADIMAQAPEVQEEHLNKLAEAEATLAKLLANQSQQTELTTKDLAINGKDLAGLGLKGPEIGAAQRELLEKVKGGEIENNKEALLAFLTNKTPG